MATTTVDRPVDFVFHTPEAPLRSADCMRHIDFIRKNKAYLTGRE